jgi:tRNA (guanine-N7-)-methyltransferase
MRNPTLKEESLDKYLLADEAALRKMLLSCPEKKIHFEIGSGNGHFLAQLAAANPDDILIGCEIDHKRVKKTIKRLELLGIHNTFLYSGRAEEVLTWLSDGSLLAFYINFPDPWPKKRHNKRRFFYPKENLQLVHQKLLDGGKLFFVSDHEEYFFFALEERLKLHDGYQCPFPQFFVSSLPGYFSTLYEEKFKKIGRRIYYTYFVKNSAGDTSQ